MARNLDRCDVVCRGRGSWWDGAGIREPGRKIEEDRKRSKRWKSTFTSDDAKTGVYARDAICRRMASTRAALRGAVVVEESS